MGEIFAAVLAKLASLFTGWLWKKHEEDDNAKHSEAVAKGEDAIAQGNDAMQGRVDAQLAEGAGLAADVRRADGGADGLRAGSDALQRAIDASKD